jgi:Ca2+-transporting ATPase
MIIDPACSIVFEAEPEESDVMSRSPRNPQEPLYGRKTVGLSMLQGLSAFVIVAIVYYITCCAVGKGGMEARAMAFTSLIFANLALILSNRSWSQRSINILRPPNPALWWIIGGALVFLIMILYIPVLQILFRFSTLHFVDILICIGAGLISLAWFELLERLIRRF